MTTPQRLTPGWKRMVASSVVGMLMVLVAACSSHTPLSRPEAAFAEASLAPPAPVVTFFSLLGWTNYRNWEYTDDQRFHTDGVYGPTAHIAPSDQLASYTAATFTAAGPSGLLVGSVWVDTTSGAVLSDSYTELQLAPGFSCVFLSNSAGWYAYVTTAAAGPNPCPTPSAPPSARLKVYAVDPPANLGPGDHTPPTARFHEGKRGGNNRPFMGLKCGAQWCMLLPQTGDSTVLPHKGHRPGKKKWEVHGWHDVQHLMVLDPANKPRISPHLASVVPDSALDNFTIEDNFDSGYVHVATVRFKAKPKGTYETKWGFRKGDNEVFLKYDASIGWTGQVRNYWMIFGVVVYTWTHDMVIRRHPHATSPATSNPPGAARFLWDDALDEGLWVRCDAGCCKVAPQ